MVICRAIELDGNVNVAHSAKLYITHGSSSPKYGDGIKFLNGDGSLNVTTSNEVTIDLGEGSVGDYAIVGEYQVAPGLKIANSSKVTLRSYWPFGYLLDPPVVTGYVLDKLSYNTGVYRYIYTKDISGSTDIRDCTYNPPGSAPDYSYSGRVERFEPAQVFMGTKKLTFGTDYYLAYSNPKSTDCGEYLAFIVGKGNYTGAKAIKYTISPRNISPLQGYTTAAFDNPVMLVKDKAEPHPKVSINFGAGGVLELQEGSDYTISYSNNTSITDSASFTITGTGNFTGSQTYNFSVDKGFTRLYGDTALDTMAAVSRQGWEDNHGGAVVIATAKSYYDALAAAPLAGATGAPILLTSASKLSPQTKNEINRINPSQVFIMGGTAAVSQDVEDELIAMSGKDGFTVERVWGETAIETAEKAAQRSIDVGTGHNRYCIVATSKSYHDALAIAPVAYSHGCAIFLTNRNGTLSDSTLQAIATSSYYDTVIVVGGEAVIPDSTYQQLSDLPNITGMRRLAGDTAIETSFAIADWAVTNFGSTSDGVGIATSQGFHDALAGAALCGKDNGVMILVPGKSANPNYYAIDHFVGAHDGYWMYGNVNYGYIFGGPAAITPEIEDYANLSMRMSG